MFKKIALIAIITALSAITMVGCQGKAETIQVAGSTSVQPLSEVWAEKFMEDNQGITVNVTGGGSSAGVTAATEGSAEIGAASRKIKQAEIDKGLVVTKVAIDGIAIIVNKDNAVTNLTIEQIRKIYTGEITNWSAVGAASADINVVVREAGSGTLDAFESIIMDKQTIKTNVNTQTATAGVRQVVSGDPNAIGFISMGSINDEIKVLSVDGVEATEANIRNGSYTVWRPFNYVTMGEPDGAVKQFIDYALSEAGQNAAVEKGFFKAK